jgi:hypothetical protein
MNFRDIRGRKLVFVPHSSSDIRTANELLDSQSIDAALERNDYSRLAAWESGIHKTTLFRWMRIVVFHFSSGAAVPLEDSSIVAPSLA